MGHRLWALAFVFLMASACDLPEADQAPLDSLAVVGPDTLTKNDSVPMAEDTAVRVVNKMYIQTGAVTPQELVAFARTLLGVPYKYGSIDPSQGFDCSGFITHVFNHFDIKVPRSSIDFTGVGRTVPLDSARPGDLVLFTGTDSTETFVGHMGIIVSNENGLVEFIHSTSGKAYSVVITPLNGYYMTRYVRTARIFHQNEG